MALAVLLVILASHLPGEPHAKHYRPGLMEQVARNRGITRLAGDTVLASRPSCTTIGQRFLVRFRIGPWERALQVDCSRPGRDATRHLRARLVVEVDYQTAVRHGFSREGHVPAQVDPGSWPDRLER